MVTEVFSRIGEEEISENSNFHRRDIRENDEYDPDFDCDEETSDSSIKVESTSKLLTEAKKEYFEHLEDDSLTVDTASQLNKNWKKK